MTVQEQISGRMGEDNNGTKRVVSTDQTALPRTPLLAY